MKKANSISDIKNDPRIQRFIKNYDGHNKHLAECVDGFKFENERTIEIGNVSEICYSINNNLKTLTH